MSPRMGDRITKESRTQMTTPPDIHGLAALTICESLLLALNDRKILPEHEIMGILHDAVATHADAPTNAYSPEVHAQVAALITRIIDSGNSVRRP